MPFNHLGFWTVLRWCSTDLKTTISVSTRCLLWLLACCNIRLRNCTKYTCERDVQHQLDLSDWIIDKSQTWRPPWFDGFPNIKYHEITMKNHEITSLTIHRPRKKIRMATVNCPKILPSPIVSPVWSKLYKLWQKIWQHLLISLKPSLKPPTEWTLQWLKPKVTKKISQSF